MTVTVETGKKLKSLGFITPTYKYWSFPSVPRLGQDYADKKNYNRDIASLVDRCSAPIQSEVQKWLREEHSIYLWVEVITHTSEGVKYDTVRYDWVVIAEELEDAEEPESLTSYEVAFEEGIMECLGILQDRNNSLITTE